VAAPHVELSTNHVIAKAKSPMQLAGAGRAGEGRVKSTSARVASLDGLRAVSIGLVLFGHLVGTRGFPLVPQAAASFLASLGVRVFFVISGFLITGLLLVEQENKGHIRLSTFYFRRAFRILVPYYVFLVAVALATRQGWVKLAPGDMAYALAYASNYHAHGAWAFGHTWSLAVEEQFYLLWPALLVLFGVRRSLFLAAAYLAVAPCWRIFLWYFHPAAGAGIGHTFGTVADSIAAGCVLTGMRERFWQSARYRMRLASRWFALVPLAILATGVVETKPRLAFTIGAVIVNLGVALCIDRCLRFPASLSTRLLSMRPLVVVGQASYSIYLWQQLFLDRSSASWTAAFPMNLIFVVVVGTIARQLVEKPSLTARVRAEAWLERVFPARAPDRNPTPAPSTPATRSLRAAA
jgi:peptidoglycan/LPS O-acetylase OafA/YrhL